MDELDGILRCVRKLPTGLCAVRSVRRQYGKCVVNVLLRLTFGRSAALYGAGQHTVLIGVNHIGDLSPELVQRVFQRQQPRHGGAPCCLGLLNVPQIFRKCLLMRWSEYAQIPEVIEIQKERKPNGVHIVDPYIAGIAVFALHIQAGHDVFRVLLSLDAVQVLAEILFQHFFIPVQGIHADGAGVPVEDRPGAEQLADVRDQQIRSALFVRLQGAHLFGDAVRFIKGFAIGQRPAGIRQCLIQQVLRRADAVGIVEGQIQILFGEQCADVLAGDRGGDGQPLMAALRRVLKEPVLHAVSVHADHIAASDEGPTEVPHAIDCLRLCKGLFLPAGNLCGQGNAVSLAFRFLFRIKQLAQPDPVHVMHGDPRSRRRRPLSCYLSDPGCIADFKGCQVNVLS